MIRKLLIGMMLCLLSLQLVSAGSYMVSVSQPGSNEGTVMQGIAFTVTVNGLSESGTAKINLPSGFSVEESEEKSFSSGTTSVSWTTVKANEKLNMQQISVTVTTQSGSESSDSDYFDVVSPPSLSLSVTPISTIMSSGSETVQITVQNWGETDAENCVATISSLSGVTVTGSSSINLGDISGGEGGSGETKAASWKITLSEGASGTLTVQVVSSNADSVSEEISVDIPGGDEDNNDDGGGSSPGGISILPKKEVLKNATKKLELIPGVGLRNNLRLQAAIEKVLAKGKMSEQAKQNMLRLSASITSDLEATREFKAEQNRSRLSMKIKYSGNETAKNFIIYDSIPKAFANSTDLITVTALGATIEIVENDPEYLFIYSELSEGNEVIITYEVFGEKEVELINDTFVEFYAESLGDSIIEGDEGLEISERICDEGAKRCLGEILQECGDNKWIAIQTCEYGCNSTSLICNSSKQGESNYGVYLLILLMVGLGVLVYLKKDKIRDIVNHMKTKRISNRD